MLYKMLLHVYLVMAYMHNCCTDGFERYRWTLIDFESVFFAFLGVFIVNIILNCIVIAKFIDISNAFDKDDMIAL